MYIGPDRIRMVVRYPAEPILGEAACHALHNMPVSQHQPRLPGKAFGDTDHVKKVFEEFIDQCIHGLVSAGEIGEIIGRCILSLTYDNVKLASFGKRDGHTDAVFGSLDLFSRPISVSDFMTELISPEYVELFKKHDYDFTLPPGIEDGVISFTSWIALSSLESFALDDSFLAHCFDRRIGIMFPCNQKGADLMITVRLSDGSYTFILIQIKCRQNVLPAAKFIYAGECLKPQNCFSRCISGVQRLFPWDKPYLALYMEIGPETMAEALDVIDFNEMCAFRNAFPGHHMLLGFESTRISSKAPMLDTFKLFCRRHVENMMVAERPDTLPFMDFISFYFEYMSEPKRCGCAVEGCKSNKCGCRKSGSPCSYLCDCRLPSSKPCLNRCKQP